MKNNYVHDNLKLGHERSNTGWSGSRNSVSQRSGSKSQERPKSELFKKVEMIEEKLEKVDKMEKSVSAMMEMIK